MVHFPFVVVVVVAADASAQSDDDVDDVDDNNTDYPSNSIFSNWETVPSRHPKTSANHAVRHYYRQISIPSQWMPPPEVYHTVMMPGVNSVRTNRLFLVRILLVVVVVDCDGVVVDVVGCDGVGFVIVLW